MILKCASEELSGCKYNVLDAEIASKTDIGLSSFAGNGDE